jgi:hypothetical protein
VDGIFIRLVSLRYACDLPAGSTALSPATQHTTFDTWDSVMADTQKAYLHGTIEFYQARTNTKMTIAAERLAVIAAITLPITALSSVLGMNLIVEVVPGLVELEVAVPRSRPAVW